MRKKFCSSSNFSLVMTIALIVCCVFMLVSMFFVLSSCNSNKNSTESSQASSSELSSESNKPGSSNTARFLNFNPESASYLQAAVKDYEKETGNKIIVDTAANGQYQTTLTAKMTTAEAPTLFVLGGPQDMAAWKNYITDISDSWAYKHLADKNNLLKSEDGKVYGIPYHIEGYGIIYNKKIYQKYFDLSNRSTTINSVDEIKSYDTLKAVAEEMQERKDELGIQGAFASTSMKTGHEFRWTTHLANIPFAAEFTVDNRNIVTENIDTVKFSFAENFKNIFDLYVNNSIIDRKRLGTVAVTDSMTEFAMGKCTMVQNGNWAWGQISAVKNNTVSEEDVGIMPIYMELPNEENTGIPVGTENFYAINSKSTKEQQDNALKFIEWMYSSETGKNHVINDLGYIAPFDTFSVNDVPANPLSREIMKWSQDTTKNNIPWVFTVFPSQNYKNKFGQALLRYAQGQKEWDIFKQFVIDLWHSESTSSIYD